MYIKNRLSRKLAICCYCLPVHRRSFADAEVEGTLEDQAEYDEYMDELQKFEDEKVVDNERNAAKLKKRKGEPMDKSLSAGHSSGLRMEQLQGYFWPLDVYKRVKKSLPEKGLAIRTFVGHETNDIWHDYEDFED